ncbi:MAG: DUF1552 domain-containing protein [Myxococcota bacterium]
MKKRWELSRRHFLRGAGLTLGLPLLDAMVPSVARAQDCASGPQRLIFSFNPNGILLDRITPAASGAQWWLSGVPDSLLGLQERGLLEDVSVITNLENVHGESGGHGLCAGAALTCSLNEPGPTVTVTDSVDQVYAQACPHLPRRSMQIGLRPSTLSGTTQTYPTALKTTQSYRGGVALPVQLPEQAFLSLFGNTDPSLTAEAFEARKARKAALLDYVLDDANRLRNKLGQNDKQKVDEYLQGVFELDQRVQAEVFSGEVCDPEIQLELSSVHPSNIDLVHDIMVRAMQCDLTRAWSFMRWGVGASDGNLSYSFVDDPIGGGPLTEQYHNISHYGFFGNENEEWKSQCAAIEQWEVRQFSRLVEKMKNTPEGDGTLLDNAAVVHYATMGSSQYHRRTEMSLLVAGRLGGTLTPGRHIPGEGGELASVWLALLHNLGVDTQSFGRKPDGSPAATSPLAL